MDGWRAGLLAWLAGVLLALAPVILGVFSLRRLERAARRETASSWLDLLRQLLTRLGCKRRVVLLKAAQRRMPMTWGVLRPKVLLPEESQEWPEERRGVVLLHELAHAKRCDYLTHLVARLVCALYWFNPLVWLAARRMVAERERACDDIVLRHGAKPADYAGQVLEISAGLSPGWLAGAGGIAMARPSNLESRLCAILDAKRNRAAVTRWAVLSALLLLTALLVPLAMLKAAPPGGSANPATTGGINSNQERQINQVIQIAGRPPDVSVPAFTNGGASSNVIAADVDEIVNARGKYDAEPTIQRIVSYGDAAVPILTNGLANTNMSDSYKFALVRCLCRIGTETSLKPVREILQNSPRGQTLWTAIREYPTNRDVEVLPQLIRLEDPASEPLATFWATERLREMIRRQPSVAGVIIASLDDDEKRWQFSWNLGNIIAEESGHANRWGIFGSSDPNTQVAQRNSIWRAWWERNKNKSIEEWKAEALVISATIPMHITAPTNSQPALSSQNPQSDWGEATNGLRTRLVAEKRQFRAGEPINIHIEVTNTSDRTIYFQGPSAPYFDGSLIVLDAEGKTPPFIGEPIQVMARETIVAPGQTLQLKPFDLTERRYLGRPGLYSVQLPAEPFPMRMPNFSMRGLPLSGRLAFEVVADAAADAGGDPIGRLLPLLPEGWSLANMAGRMARLRPGNNREEVQEGRELMLYSGNIRSVDGKVIWLWLTDQPAAERAAGPGDTTPASEYLGQAGRLHIYINVDANALKGWPTAKEDILRALQNGPGGEPRANPAPANESHGSQPGEGPSANPQLAAPKPGEGGSAIRNPQLGWGEPVEGFQVRLRAPADAGAGEAWPRLLVDITNQGPGRFVSTTNSFTWQLQVDGHWYVSKDNDSKVTWGSDGLAHIWGGVAMLLDLVPGQAWTNLPLDLDSPWRLAGPEEVTTQRFSSWVMSYPDNPLMKLPPGKHTVRVAVVAGPMVRAVSNPVEIEIANSANSETRSTNSSQFPAASSSANSQFAIRNPQSAAAPARIPKSPETILAELRNILPEDWTCQLDLNPGPIQGPIIALVTNPLFRIDFTNLNILIRDDAGSFTLPRPIHPHPYLRLYFLPLSEKARLDRGTNAFWGRTVIGVGETPDYFVATSTRDINSGRTSTVMERSIAPMGRALQRYFGKFADEKTGDVLGLEAVASDGLTTGIGITGQVVDDQTGKPIKEFHLEWSAADPNQPGGDLVLQRNIPGDYFGGRFGSQFRLLGSVWSMVEYFQGGQSRSDYDTYFETGQKVWPRIRADGYLTEPVTPEPVVWPAKLTNLMIRLKRAGESAPPAAQPGSP
jgi:beta-lactamase regulating signal transducer with metallopeptidase domain